MNEDTIIELTKMLDMLSKKGMQFNVNFLDGEFSLKPKEVIKYLQDPDKLAAEKYGVTVRAFCSLERF